MKDIYEKIMKTRYRKMKKQLQWNNKKTRNSTTDVFSNSKKMTNSFSVSKIDVLSEELFLTKQSERKLKNENSDLKFSLQKCTEDTNLKNDIIMKLKSEKDMLDSQIQTGQAEIEHLNQLIKEKEKVQKNEHLPVKKETEYQKEIANQKKLIEKLREGKFNTYESNGKHLNIQLRKPKKK